MDLATALARVQELAGRALRVLAIVHLRVDPGEDLESSLAVGGLTLLRLVCLINRLGPSRSRRVARCRAAGVLSVKMITR